ncbi:hypothetical protein LX36DRAFT_269090 [Colletotrichum falcatum]|nr:hypothetical protein LX36DRAFT_269090 [Colletotrichum falcatum]
MARLSNAAIQVPCLAWMYRGAGLVVFFPPSLLPPSVSLSFLLVRLCCLFLPSQRNVVTVTTDCCNRVSTLGDDGTSRRVILVRLGGPNAASAASTSGRASGTMVNQAGGWGLHATPLLGVNWTNDTITTYVRTCNSCSQTRRQRNLTSGARAVRFGRGRRRAPRLSDQGDYSWFRHHFGTVPREAQGKARDIWAVRRIVGRTNKGRRSLALPGPSLGRGDSSEDASLRGWTMGMVDSWFRCRRQAAARDRGRVNRKRCYGYRVAAPDGREREGWLLMSVLGMERFPRRKSDVKAVGSGRCLVAKQWRGPETEVMARSESSPGRPAAPSSHG